MSRTTSDLRSKIVNKGELANPSARTAPTNRPHIAAAAAIDEMLAHEARANIRRTREALRDEAPKARMRINVPPARIVAKPLQSPAWKAPFFSLAMVVGISTLTSAGGIAYLFMRPQMNRNVSETELRSLRESVTQLRRQVADVLSNATAIHAANASKPSIERVAARHVEREPPMQRTRATRNINEASTEGQIAPVVEFTGSLQASVAPTATAARNTIDGWYIRRVFDGAALLEGKPGIIEVSPGQDVPTLGRIQEIKNDDGRWQVITSKGIVFGR